MPLYRQEQDWHQLGVDFTRATLANWIIYCADNYFRPMYDYLHRQLLQRKYLMADETRIQVSDVEPDYKYIIARCVFRYDYITY